ncbi:MAG: HAMP domain-containing histidine kinase [Gammaproteobacteria bacterium]|nr:HAMP domain-containing histidine kinase [Gammaproteobacteria bacterium]
MPRLFLKLFGTFWITTVLILSISIFASFRLADDQMAERLADPREIDASLREEMSAGGLDALRDWVADAGNFLPGQTVYVVDTGGVEILGRDVPVFLMDRLDRIWAMLERWKGEGRDYDDRYRGFTPVLETADGSRWLAIPGPTSPPRFGILSTGNLRWLVVFLAAITSLLTFWLLSRSLARPAGQIVEAVKRFATGDMATRVGSASRSNDEIGEIARQFDNMASQLESQRESKRELFRNISHELRAPLARLQIATELLDRKPEQTDQQLVRVRSEIAVLDALTAQVLSLTRASQPEGRDQKVSLAEILERVVGNARLEANAKDLTVECAEPANGISVPADATLLASAIENVVRNAIQATSAGGKVTIATHAENNNYIIAVTDSGAGVPEDELERIFEPFYRLDTNREGSGIGLAITARVMEQIGGSVDARRADSRGLVVTLSIPTTAE